MHTNTCVTLKIAVPVPLRQYFDYLPLGDINLRDLKPGIRVIIPFQRRELVGILIEVNESMVPLSKLKPIIAVLDHEPVMSPDIFKLCFWAANYYHAPIGEVFSNALPVLLRQGKQSIFSKKASLKNQTEKRSFEMNTPLTLNLAQETAMSMISDSLHQFRVFLLDGITGSGKTEVYLQVIEKVLTLGKQVLVLVPEIGLTPQTINRFQARFSVSIATLHSGLSERERLDTWLYAKKGIARIVIGTRSAIFTPFLNIGLIIIDEEHDLSFKQQDGFRYHARDLAIVRAEMQHIPIVLGSATPAIDTLYKAEKGKFKRISLPDRAGTATLPQFKVIDIRNQPLDEGLSPTLLNEMQAHLSRQEQVMLFLNRRGFAPSLMCHVCGWLVDCKRCERRMTYHKQVGRLFCHHCDAQKKYSPRCESCGENLYAVGMGTERLENALEKHFPRCSIARIDRDSTKRKGTMEKLLEGIQSGAHQILVGTQMLAKGHHFPNVTLVAIVDADAGLFSTDFRGLERMGQLLIQVAGRAGRVDKPGVVLLQTHHPENPILSQLFQENYHQFATTLLHERRVSSLPPFSYFALFRAEGYKIEEASHFLHAIKKLIRPSAKSIQVLGPIPAPMAKRAGRHRVQLLLQAPQRVELQQCLKNLLLEVNHMPHKHRIRWSLDVDPVEMF